MKFTRSTLPGAAWLCLAAALLVQGCAQKGTWDGVYTVDKTGRAKACVSSPALPPDGTTVLATMNTNNDGGWCGIVANRQGKAYDSYLLEVHPAHGRVYAHHVGQDTRIDYTPDPGYVGPDRFSVRLIPGNAVVESNVTVVR
jgi:hypothetical protein